MTYLNTSKSLNLIRWLIVAILYALLITPLLLSSKFFFPYISSKTFYFRLLVEVALVLYIILAFADKKFRPIKNKLVWAVFIYLAVVLATSLVGVNLYRSFWGNTERGEGLLTFLHVIAFFVVVVGVLRDWKSWERFLTAMVFISLLTAVYATLQKTCPNIGLHELTPESTGFDRFCANRIVSGDVSRISALIGNAAFYAGYLLVNAYIALWLALYRPGIIRKIFFGTILVYDLIILNYTKTRGALLALFISFFVFLLLLIFGSRRRRLKFFTSGVLVIFLISGTLVYIFRDSNFVQKAGGLENVTHISLTDVTTESRLLTWNASWQAWKDRFFVGYGYENFNIAFNKYFPAEIFRDSGSQIWFDRAHNIFFDVSLTSGIFGILLYFSLFGLSFWYLWNFYRRDPENNLITSAIFGSLLLGYFIQNFFVFDTLSTYIAFYTLLAFIVFLYAQPQRAAKTIAAPVRPINPILVLVLVLGLGFGSYSFVIKPVQANLKVTEALLATARGRYQETLDKYKEAIEMDNYINEEARQKLSEAVVGFRGSAELTVEAKTKGFRQAIEEMKIAIEKSPKDARNYLFLMALYNNLPNNEAGPREEVIRLGKEVLELSPTRPQIYYEMGQAAFSLGRQEESIGYFKKAVELNEYPAESHWNLALVLALSGKPDQAEKEVDFIYDNLRIHKITDSGMRNLINIYKQMGQWRPAARLLSTQAERYPNDADLLMELGGVSGQFCELNSARVHLQKAVELNPELAQKIEAGLAELEILCQISQNQ